MTRLGISVAFIMQFLVTLLLMQLKCFQAQPDDQKNNDRLALLAFKAKITHDAENSLRSWNDSVLFCDWEGVVCGKKHRRVTILDLHSNGLVGFLSPYIGNMSFLKEIRLQNNSLQGEIPQEIGNLFRLQALHLENNSFTGRIPSNLSYCTNLVILRLSYNFLVGKITEGLATWLNIRQLSLQSNHLVGSIPSFLGNFSSLISLSASENFLSGTIPESLGQLRFLLIFAFHANNLSGIIPPAIYNISSINVFLVSNNSFHGNIPSSICLSLPHLRRLQMWGNRFTGSIPVSLSNASEISIIDIGSNAFTGGVTVDFGGLQKLVHFNLYDTNLGTQKGDDLNFITSLFNCSNLVMLELSGNQFQGTFPSSVANISSPIWYFSIGMNRIYGGIPPWLSTIVSLSFLNMQFNQISGTIPAEIGKLQNLNRLYLDTNRLSGPIPSSIGNLTSLTVLSLAINDIHGSIPSSLGNLHNLLMMNLSVNKLNGYIPSQLFPVSNALVSIDLSQNQLVGSLPSEIGNLFSLNGLTVSHNKLSGTITDGLGRCRSLEFLRMDDNNFEGKIPASFESLTGLRQLNLSKNHLSGGIPEYFANLALEYLNLSANNFEGEVHGNGIFANASILSIQGNGRLCGGVPELRLPRCMVAEIKRNKSHAVKIAAISISCVVGAIMMSAFLYCKFRNRKQVGSANVFLSEPFREISYNMILKATDGFSSNTLIGVGSFGSVYRGQLDEDGTVVAIKVVNLQRQGASKSFMAECQALRNIRHRNLVKIITACSSIDFQGNEVKALVYEYMPNGSLEQWLHPNSETERNSLSLLQRIDIAIDIANALDYLHNQCHNSIIHCDLKPSNVLLDNDMVAHVADFGLAKFLSQLANDHSLSSSIGVRGTIGYAPPEYGMGSDVRISGDIYSYGILLLEMMTGQAPTSSNFVEGENLHNICRMAMPNQVLQIVDKTILHGDDNYHQEERSESHNIDHKVGCIVSMIEIGIACSMESPQDRIDTSNALSHLLSVRKNYLRSMT